MLEIILILGITPTITNIVLVNKKINRTINVIKEKIKDKGYILQDENIEKSIKKIMKKYNSSYIDNMIYLDYLESFVPVLRWNCLYKNINCIKGIYKNTDLLYLVMENIIDDKDNIKTLENQGKIEKKKEVIDKRNKKIDELKKQKRILYNLKQTNKEEIKKYNLSLNKKL